jgi:formate C-acetyltransferase
MTDTLPRTLEPWRDFSTESWREGVAVREFIQQNYAPYHGDAGFLAGPTDRTRGVWGKLTELFPVEQQRGIYDVDVSTPSTIISHGPG